MAGLDRLRVGLVLPVYVFGASLFGLAIPMGFGGFDLFVKVWQGSVVGDFVFVFGMGAVGWLAYEAARTHRQTLALAFGLLGTWLVFALSFLFTNDAWQAESPGGDFSGIGSGNVWWFVLGWGIPGIAWGTIAPMWRGTQDARSRRTVSVAPAPS